MSRRLTGWVLTAAVIAALPAPALSSNDPNNDLGPDFRRAVAGDDGDYTRCLEVTPEASTGLRNAGAQPPQDGPPTIAAGKAPPVDIYLPEHPAEGIAAEIARAKRGAADQAMRPGPLLIDRNLPPNGTVQPDHIKAACGIPRGLTLLAPVERELRPVAAN